MPRSNLKFVKLFLVGVVLFLSACAPDTDSQYSGHRQESSNMSLLGQHDLQGRSAYQPVIERQGELWVAYIGLMGGQAKNEMTGNVEVDDRANTGMHILELTGVEWAK